MTKWITITLDFKATGSIFSPVPLGHYWTKESLLGPRLWWSVDTLNKGTTPAPDRTQSDSKRSHHTIQLTLLNDLFQGFYLLHLNHRWPWINESGESKTTGKEDTKDDTSFSYSFMESNMAITQIVVNISNPYLHKNTELNIRGGSIIYGILSKQCYS